MATEPSLRAIADLERLKFTEKDEEWCVRTTIVDAIEGSFSPSGLKNGGKVTEATLNSSTWTPLPLVALTDRNAIAIQNLSGFEIKVNYDDSVSAYEGMVIPDGGERQYDITDAIIIYGKAETGATPTVTVEELS